MHPLPLAVLIGATVLAARAVPAAGPYVVDDAAITEADTLQIESWYSHADTRERIGVVNLAYQLLPNAEFSLQETHLRRPGSDNDGDVVSVQAKYLWREGGDVGSVAVVSVLGGGYSLDTQRMATFYAYVPVTLRAAEALDVHVNLGWLYDREARRHFATWGLGMEYRFAQMFSLVGEVFGRNEGRSGFQLGPGILLTDGLRLDMVYGHNVLAKSDDMVTVGLSLGF
jgi:hypothetical protein